MDNFYHVVLYHFRLVLTVSLVSILYLFKIVSKYWVFKLN